MAQHPPYLTQPLLVSGQNIKTVGGESLLGSGDVDAVSSDDLQSALDDRELGIHPDSDTLLEIIDGPAYGAGGSITFGTAPPSGGIDGDIYLQYSL